MNNMKELLGIGKDTGLKDINGESVKTGMVVQYQRNLYPIEKIYNETGTLVETLMYFSRNWTGIVLQRGLDFGVFMRPQSAQSNLLDADAYWKDFSLGKLDDGKIEILADFAVDPQKVKTILTTM